MKSDLDQRNHTSLVAVDCIMCRFPRFIHIHYEKYKLVNTSLFFFLPLAILVCRFREFIALVQRDPFWIFNLRMKAARLAYLNVNPRVRSAHAFLEFGLFTHTAFLLCNALDYMDIVCHAFFFMYLYGPIIIYRQRNLREHTVSMVKRMGAIDMSIVWAHGDQ